MAMPQRLGTSASEGGLSVNSRLSDARREKLTKLKKREDMKDALTDKFKGRFGSGARTRGDDEMSVCSSHIRREVDRFAATADVTEANLGRLERRLACKARQKGSDEGSVLGVSAYSGASRQSRSVGSRSVASLAGDCVVGRDGIARGVKPGSLDWARLDDYASYLHEQDALRQKQGVAALQRKLRMDLDRQVAERNAKKEDGDEEDRRYHQNLMVELDRWKQTEQTRAEEYKAKQVREKEDRDAQLAFETKLKADWNNKKKAEEAQLVTKIVNEMEAEQKRYETKKIETRKSMKKVFEENAKDQQQKDEAKRIQTEQEGEQMREYNRLMDEQEEARANEMQDRMEKQQELMAKLQCNVEAATKSAGDNDALRAKAQADEINRHQAEAEGVKQDRLKQMRLENQSFLRKQMQEKACRGSEEKELQAIQAEILRRDTDEYNEAERQKVVLRKLRNFEHRQEVERQMEWRASQYWPDMSEAEVKMNRNLLNLVHRTLETRDAASAARGPEQDEDAE